MAKPPATIGISNWRRSYQLGLRAYGNGPRNLKLNQAIAECIFALRKFRADGSSFAQRTQCIIALSDLLVLRILQARYDKQEFSCITEGEV